MNNKEHLSGLYPFLHGKAQDAASMNDALLETVRQKAADHVYVRQIIAQGREGDCLIGMSTSGNFENLLRAFTKARDMELSNTGLAGMSGDEMAKACPDACRVVETDSIHRIQECIWPPTTIVRSGAYVARR